MKQLDEIGFADILNLVGQYQAFVYIFKHSMINDPVFREGIVKEDKEGELLKDYDFLIQTFDAVLSTEDNILDTDWLFTEMREDEEMQEDEDSLYS